jgi:hypothetical protein
MMHRLAVLPTIAFLAVVSAIAQYKMEPVASLPEGVPENFGSLLNKQGYRVAGPNGPFCEVWFRTALPAGPKSAEDAVSFPTIPIGSYIGIVRFPGAGADRRGQGIKAGVYTLRYANYPINGDHQGVAPQRDFAVLSPIAEDKDPAATPAFDPLMVMSRKASGTPHPAVLSLEQAPSGAAVPSVVKEGEKDWVLTVKIGDATIALIVVGKTEA